MIRFEEPENESWNRFNAKAVHLVYIPIRKCKGVPDRMNRFYLL